MFLIKIIFLDEINRCQKCGKHYRTAGTLKRHQLYTCGRVIRPVITGYNSTQDGFECQTCKRTYKVFGSLKRHLTYECGKSATILCPVSYCNYKAKVNDRMTQHMRMVHKIEC